MIQQNETLGNADDDEGMSEECSDDRDDGSKDNNGDKDNEDDEGLLLTLLLGVSVGTDEGVNVFAAAVDFTVGIVVTVGTNDSCLFLLLTSMASTTKDDKKFLHCHNRWYEPFSKKKKKSVNELISRSVRRY